MLKGIATDLNGKWAIKALPFCDSYVLYHSSKYIFSDEEHTTMKCPYDNEVSKAELLKWGATAP